MRRYSRTGWGVQWLAGDGEDEVAGTVALAEAVDLRIEPRLEREELAAAELPTL